MQACQTLGLGRTSVYAAMSSGRLRSVTVGRRRLVPDDAIDDFIAQLPTFLWEVGMNTKPITRFYTVAQVADLLAVSQRSVRRWIAAGRVVGPQVWPTGSGLRDRP